MPRHAPTVLVSAGKTIEGIMGDQHTPLTTNEPIANDNAGERRPDRRSGSRVSRCTPFEELPEWLSPEEVRAYLNLGRTVVYELIRTGALRHRRFGRSIKVPKSALADSDTV